MTASPAVGWPAARLELVVRLLVEELFAHCSVIALDVCPPLSARWASLVPGSTTAAALSWSLPRRRLHCEQLQATSLLGDKGDDALFASQT